MDTDALKASPRGRVVPTIDDESAFVPDPLPRRLDLPVDLVYLLDEASRAVAMLAGVGETLPNPYLLFRPFLRREAVLSSQIEGTRTTVAELLLFEAAGPRTAPGDAPEVANYVRALEQGLDLLRKLPLSVRLLNEVHRVLLTGVRGGDKRPGELRQSQVIIGPPGSRIQDAIFVPPPHQLVRDLLGDLEGFINEDLRMPPLVRCALAHYQFEAIHPYLDGNGRLGRLLILLMLCAAGVLPKPLLYLSAYFERNRSAYYDQLLQVSITGEWEPWLQFFLAGVLTEARDALSRSRRLRDLRDAHLETLLKAGASANATRLTEELLANPFVTAPLAAALLGVTPAGASRIIERLVGLGIIRYRTGTWPRVYVAPDVLEAITAERSPGS